MTKRFTLSLIALAASFSAFSVTVPITNSGFTFSPSNVTITEGDDVLFTLGSMHDAREVSQTTWNANQNTALNGGFQTPFTGGMVSASSLTVGTHWYVCSNHAGSGMKGIIVVTPATSIAEPITSVNFSVYPNPTNGIVTVVGAIGKNLSVYNAQGVLVKTIAIVSAKQLVDLADLSRGVYYTVVANGDVLERQRIIKD